jgi:hypothetical protein
MVLMVIFPLTGWNSHIIQHWVTLPSTFTAQPSLTVVFQASWSCVCKYIIWSITTGDPNAEVWNSSSLLLLASWYSVLHILATAVILSSLYLSYTWKDQCCLDSISLYCNLKNIPRQNSRVNVKLAFCVPLFSRSKPLVVSIVHISNELNFTFA